MQSISLCFINFENVPSKRYTAIVGRINQNEFVTFGKICHLFRAGTALNCTVIKRTIGAQAGRLEYPYFESQLPAKMVQLGPHRDKASDD